MLIDSARETYELELHGTAVARRCGYILFGVSVAGEARKREIGLGLVER